MHFPKMTFACGQALLVALLDNVNQSHLNEKLSNMWMILQVLSLSCFLRCSRILISSWACRWNLFSFLTILRATCWWVLWSYTLSTWPNEPLPITFRISYLWGERNNFQFRSSRIFSFNGADDELNGKMVERELDIVNEGHRGEGVGRPIGYLSSLTASTIHCWHSCKIAALLAQLQNVNSF